MQYVRSISGSVSKTWNSINPATLSGAIDVIVLEQEDGRDITRLKDHETHLHCRLTGLFPFSCSVRQILTSPPVREKGALSFLTKVSPR